VNLPVSKRITQARELAGFSKAELAKLLDVSPAAVAQWENGSKHPTADNLQAISRHLGFSMPLLIRPIPEPIFVRGPLTFRAWTSAVSRKSNRRAFRLAELFAEVYFWLSDRVNFPENNLPDIECKDDPEEMAQECRRAWGLGNRPILKLGELLESKGVVLGSASFGDDRFDAFSCVISGRPFIFLGDEKKDAARSRFDACHELAHLALVEHQQLTESDLCDPKTLSKIEAEANAFAGAFLLPEETFGPDVLDVTLDGFLKLKSKWAVSVQAMVFRAHQLELISHSQYQELFRQISVKGWRKKRGEPLDECIPEVKRSLGKRSLELIESNKVMHAWEIPSELPMPQKILCDIFQADPELFEPAELERIIAVDFKSVARQSSVEELAR